MGVEGSSVNKTDSLYGKHNDRVVRMHLVPNHHIVFLMISKIEKQNPWT